MGDPSAVQCLGQLGGLQVQMALGLYRRRMRRLLATQHQGVCPCKSEGHKEGMGQCTGRVRRCVIGSAINTVTNPPGQVKMMEESSMAGQRGCTSLPGPAWPQSLLASVPGFISSHPG